MAGMESSPSGSAAPPSVASLGAQSSLLALKALMSVEASEGSFAPMLEALRSVFDSDRALVLEERDGNLHCIAALPDDAASQQWSAAAIFRTVALGRVVASDPNSNRQGW